LKSNLDLHKLLDQVRRLKTPTRFKAWLDSQVAELEAHGATKDSLDFHVLELLSSFTGGKDWDHWVTEQQKPISTGCGIIPSWDDLLTEAINIQVHLENVNKWNSDPLEDLTTRLALQAMSKSTTATPTKSDNTDKPTTSPPSSTNSSSTPKKAKNSRNKYVIDYDKSPAWKFIAPKTGEPTEQTKTTASGHVCVYTWKPDRVTPKGTGYWTGSRPTPPPGNAITPKKKNTTPPSSATTMSSYAATLLQQFDNRPTHSSNDTSDDE
jgi:hypothetical protein